MFQENWHILFIYIEGNGRLMQDMTYTEDAPILPRLLTYILAGVLLSTLACMAVMDLFTNSGMPSWMIPVTLIIFIVVLVIVWFAKFGVKVTSEGVEVNYLFKKYFYERDRIIDKRCGDLEDIKCYSKWDLKGVKRKTFIRIGDENGVALKIKGMEVVVISSSDYETLFEAVPVEIIEEGSEDA